MCEGEITPLEDTIRNYRNILKGLLGSTNQSALLFPKKHLKTHPEEAYFIHASLSIDRKVFTTQNGMKKKKRSVYISNSVWKIGRRIKNVEAPLWSSWDKIACYGNPERKMSF